MKREARFFKSLADETRLKILWLLSAAEELCVCDVINVLGITQSKASRHLRYLYHLGWVTDRRDGLWMNYRLTVPPVARERSCSSSFRKCWRLNPKPRNCGGNWNIAWRPNGIPSVRRGRPPVIKRRPRSCLKPKFF